MIADSRGALGKPRLLRAGTAIQRQLVRDDPGYWQYRIDLSRYLQSLGRRPCLLGSHEEGLGLEREALGLAEAAVISQPDNIATLRHLADALTEVGYHLGDLGEKDQAIAMLERGIEVLEGMVRLEPGVRDHRSALADAYTSLGGVLTGADRLDEALDAYRHVLNIGQQLARENPDDAGSLATEPISLAAIGDTLYRAQRPDQALPVLLRARDRWKVVLGDRTYPMYFRAYSGDNLLRLGSHPAIGRPREALDCLRQAEAIHRAERGRAEDVLVPLYLALARRIQGGLLQRAGRHDEALAALREARAILEAMSAPTNFDRLNLATCLAQLQVIARSAPSTSEGRTIPEHEEVRQLGDQAMHLLREAAGKSKPRPSRFVYLVDPDLEPLRSRDDFRALIRDIDFDGSWQGHDTPMRSAGSCGS